MAKDLVHRATKSWWSGKFTTLCGIEFERGESRSPWFINPKCPTCELLHNAKKGK